MKFLTINGQRYQIRFSWDALQEINEKHGDGPNMFNPDVVASIAAIGMVKYHPGMTAQKIKELSPPLIPFAKETQAALQWAYFGDEGLPKESASGEKKSLIPVGLWRPFKWLAGMASIRRHSGG